MGNIDDNSELAPIAKMCQFLDPKMRMMMIQKQYQHCTIFALIFLQKHALFGKLHYQVVVVMLIRICTFFSCGTIVWPIFALGEMRRHSCKRQRPLSVFPSTKNYILTLLTTLFEQMLSD